MTRKQSQFSQHIASMIMDSQAIIVSSDSVKAVKPEYPVKFEGFRMS